MNNEVVEVLKVEITKYTPQKDDIIIVKLSNIEKYPVSKLNSLNKQLHDSFPDLNFIMLSANDDIQVIKRELKDA